MKKTDAKEIRRAATMLAETRGWNVLDVSWEGSCGRSVDIAAIDPAEGGTLCFVEVAMPGDVSASPDVRMAAAAEWLAERGRDSRAIGLFGNAPVRFDGCRVSFVSDPRGRGYGLDVDQASGWAGVCGE